MDPYLFKPEDDVHGSSRQALLDQRISRVGFWLHPAFLARDVRLIVGCDGGAKGLPDVLAALRTFSAAINHQDARGSEPLDIKVLPLDAAEFPFLHDRFAIVDDELWHFGSTVGGFHPGLTAASRGWPVEATRALGFFEKAWRHLLDSNGANSNKRTGRSR